ncbi:hypothetical protein SAMN05428939_7677 [Streptomyces sp. TLI_105]|nr:hypothetical protein SAMN05428939_7677 [Streptomyces sp. TLI_105]
MKCGRVFWAAALDDVARCAGAALDGVARRVGARIDAFPCAVHAAQESASADGSLAQRAPVTRSRYRGYGK